MLLYSYNICRLPIGLFFKRYSIFTKRYRFCKLPCIRVQIELSCTFVYDYKMSTGGSRQNIIIREKYNSAIELRSQENFQSCKFIVCDYFYFPLWYNSVRRHEHHYRSSSSWGANRTIARCRHFTTTTRILQFAVFLCKLSLLFF